MTPPRWPTAPRNPVTIPPRLVKVAIVLVGLSFCTESINRWLKGAGSIWLGSGNLSRSRRSKSKPGIKVVQASGRRKRSNACEAGAKVGPPVILLSLYTSYSRMIRHLNPFSLRDPLESIVCTFLLWNKVHKIVEGEFLYDFSLTFYIQLFSKKCFCLKSISKIVRPCFAALSVNGFTH